MSKQIPEISRVTRSKEEARQAYDRMSKWYDLLSEGSEKKYKEIGRDMLNVNEGEKILDIGFGTGHNMISFAQSVGIEGKVYGIDLSQGMYTEAEKKIKKAGFEKRVELMLGDAISLPYTNHFFDGIFMSFTLELFDTPEIELVLKECKRVLKEDGRLCVVAMSRNANPGLMLKMYEWAHHKFPKYIDCRPIYLQQVLEEMNFRIVKKEEMMMWGLPVEIILAAVNPS